MASSPIRFATFNASLNRTSAGQLIDNLSTPDDSQAQAVAEIIQRTNPDVLLINEFDYDAAGQAAALFRGNYLAVGQNGIAPVDYPYVYAAPSNTGIPSGFDLDNNGSVGGPNDAQGFGFFPGQFGFVVYSKYPILEDHIRTFQEFLWKDMPGARLPQDPLDVDGNGDTSSWFTAEELEVVRLSSKNHVDVPVAVNGDIIHVLASHPTPPVFDGPEDRNGTRNADEIRFWADYINGADYIYDDNGGTGGLEAGAKFVIMGDQNADPFDGDSVPGAAQQLLENPLVNTAVTPSSVGGPDAANRQGGTNETHLGDPAFDTADFGFAGVGNPDVAPGNLRADYVLPSNNLGITDAKVFWQESTDPLFPLAEFPTSDHRLVYVDVADTLPNGVASGDVAQDSAVLWTRSTVTGAVTFEYSTRADFSAIAGTTTATVTDATIPVKVAVDGLTAATEYYYRVQDAAGNIKTGRFKTAADGGDQTGLTFGVTGDWRGELAPYPAISNVAAKELDFFLKHGDTIYADDDSPALTNPDGSLKQQAETLADFRIKHDEVYSERFGENFWADIQASTPVFATIDDHEVTNDFAGGQPIGTDARFTDAFPGDDPNALINDSTLYENGLQVFQEYNPIRDEFYGETGDAVTANERKLYRANTFGADAATFVLDTRSFRDTAIPTPVNPFDPAQVGATYAATFTPGRTLLGAIQKEDLKADLLEAQNAGVTWKFVMVPEPFQNLFPGISTDAWDGYNAERTELLKFIEGNAIQNVVFVAADVHMTSVNNITYQEVPFGEHIATSTFEITTGAVAYEDPTGRFLGEVFTASDPALTAFYNSLPIAPDGDDLPNDKDDFVKAAINSVLLAPLGFDPVGLDDNLPQAAGLIDATLLQGDYYVGHSSTWTEFDIDPITQKLTVTTYGVDGYEEAQLLANPEAIINQTPVILSQFEVNPGGFSISGGSEVGETLLGDITANRIAGFGGNDTIAGGLGNDVIFGGDGDDVLRGDLNSRRSGGTIGGDDIIRGGNGNDRIGGKSGNDILFGDAGDDAIWGDDGDDILRGGLGNDRLTGDDFSGGTGADTFVLAVGEGTDTIVDYGNGADIIQILGATSVDQIQDGSNVLLKVGDETLAIVNDATAGNLNLTFG
ncbi:MAG: alkaline phosphatase D family protein [Cyanobacteria bacterium]|nr:alkaline phosphatase D family protein [Cyanobacteriota bacterium]